MPTADPLTIRLTGQPVPIAAQSAVPRWALSCDPRSSTKAAPETQFRLLAGSASALEGAVSWSLQDVLGMPLTLCSGGSACWRREDSSFQTRALLPDPMRIALAQQWAQAGAMMLHAAAVQVNKRGVLILGDSGAGKSTLALAALHAGGSVVSDDWLLLVPGSPLPVVRRLRAFLSVRPASGALLEIPELAGLLQRKAQDGRTYLDLPVDSKVLAAFPEQIAIHQVLHVQPPLPGAARLPFTQVQPSSAEQMFMHLLRASVPLLFDSHLPVERSALLATVNALLKSSRCFSAQSGNDVLVDAAGVWARLCM